MTLPTASLLFPSFYCWAEIWHGISLWNIQTGSAVLCSLPASCLPPGYCAWESVVVGLSSWCCGITAQQQPKGWCAVFFRMRRTLVWECFSHCGLQSRRLVGMQTTQSFLLYYSGFLAQQTCVGWDQFLNSYFYQRLGSKKSFMVLCNKKCVTGF